MYEGGAIVLQNCNSTFLGNNSFRNNTANFGGAVSVNGGTYSTSGIILFTNNTAMNGGAMAMTDVSHNSIGNISFTDNVATNGSGGAMLISGGSHNISGNISFLRNSAHLDDLDFRGGGAISMVNGNHCIIGHISFEYNSAPNGNGGAMSLSDISSEISGEVFFIGNTAKYDGGAMVLFIGTSRISGKNISFIDNSVSSRNGGSLSINSGWINISGISSFIRNTARYEAGALEFYRSAGEISGNSTFINNSVLYTYGSGGAVEMDTINGESLILSGIQRFLQNSAERGGAMAFFGRYKLRLTSPLKGIFTENRATDYGGALYFADDTSARVQCAIPYFSRDNCHLELSSLSDITLNFTNNTAGSAGSVLYGGGLDTCRLYTGGGYRESDGEIVGGSYSNNPPKTIRSISVIVSKDNVVRDISSNRLKVCVCEDGKLECESLYRSVVRGQTFTLLVSVVGQDNEFVSNSTVRISLEDDVQINPAQRLQENKKECAPVSYRLLSYRSQTFVTLSPDNSVCQDGLRVNVTFLPCPDAFALRGSECVCESRLQSYNTTCNVADGSIMRSRTDTFWMKPLYENEMFEGLILHSHCPFDYCVDAQVNITFGDLDAQCNYNHSGILCGSCKDNFSIALGTLHCLPCTNSYLALLLPFILVGVSLVAVLLLLQVSVANGTINGLIFFANIIQANRSDFFPLGDTNILTVFIAWLNLDLGIETCFYDGMTTYVYAWLQFLFPFYVWFLIGLIIFACRYSSKIAGRLGKNPVAILATLFLLSYSKILQNIITALSLTQLDFPDSSKYVWLYDGNLPYFQRADHFVLGIFAILVFILLFLPYTLLLLCSPWLLTYSHWRILSWLNKIKPFLDAYYGPYKKQTRYWTALLLLVRCVLLLAFALNTLSNSKFDLLLVTSLTAGVSGLAWVHRGVYEKLYNDVIEASFILNLCIFSAASYHVEETGGSASQAALAYISVGIAFTTFVCIVIFHIVIIVRRTPEWKKISKMYNVMVSSEKTRDEDVKQDSEQLADLNKSTTVTTTELELREPLLV
jgi:predicted outer membrane repeat protein